jgi:anti-anti-sigma regulatory factor
MNKNDTAIKIPRKRTIYLPQALDDEVYSTLQRSFEDSRGEDLVIDMTHLGVVDARCVDFLRSAMRTWNADRHSLVVVKGGGGGAPATQVSLPDPMAA